MNNRKGALRTRPHPSKSQTWEDVNSLARREPEKVTRDAPFANNHHLSREGLFLAWQLMCIEITVAAAQGRHTASGTGSRT